MITSDYTLTKNTTYSVNDVIQVYNGAILQIEEGVILRSTNNSNITFVITEGSKVIALGSYTNPIKAIGSEITSEQPTIIMTSSLAKEDNTTNQFSYRSINNPTLLKSQQPISNTAISSANSNF